MVPFKMLKNSTFDLCGTEWTSFHLGFLCCRHFANSSSVTSHIKLRNRLGVGVIVSSLAAKHRFLITLTACHAVL